MKREGKILIFLIIFMMLSVLIWAGGKEEVQAGAAEEKIEEKEKEPQYGGTLILGLRKDTSGFDQAYGTGFSAPNLHMTNECLTFGDWSRGPAGTDETKWGYPGRELTYMTGCLLESWEIPDQDHIILHVRQGVHFQNKPPVNGREMTADDVAFTINRQFTEPTAYLARVHKGWFKSAEVTDEWTVVVTGEDSARYPSIYTMAMVLGDEWIVPRDLIEHYGDIKDWRNANGTGPFSLVDYVAGSHMTFDRNPTYWGKDPVGPGKGNQLPYLDHVRMQVIEDPSTRIAAMRTAKVDWIYEVGWEDGEALLKQRPEIEYHRAQLRKWVGLFMRTDTKPFDDIRVRRALHMAVDLQGITDAYYGGNAVTLNFPIMNSEDWPEYKDSYVPLEELPESTRELFEYKPEKAKQLLAEAGYPDGFKTNVIGEKKDAALLSLFAGYFKDIGVDLEIKIKEPTVFKGIYNLNEHDQMIAPWLLSSHPYDFTELDPIHDMNCSIVDDPYINEKRAVLNAYENKENKALRDKYAKELSLYSLDKAYVIQTPAPYQYRLWWPWLKNYHGELVVGMYNYYNFAHWVWIDQDMKKAMGH